MKDSRTGKSDRKPWHKGPGGKRSGGYAAKHSGVRAGGSGEPGRGRQHPVARRDMPDDGIVRIFGSHAVEAALANPNRRVIRLLATENAEMRLAEVIAARRVLIDRATPGDLDHLLGADTVHQGLLLEAQPLEEPLLAELAERAKTHGPLVLLDHVTDPHNFGAVLRSAAAFGTAGLIMTRRHSPPLNGVLAKAASGALDLVPVLPVQNLAKTMDELKAQGFRLIGLEGASDARLEDEPFDGLCAIVLGAEGKGLRELTSQTCDRLVSITTGGALHSLNVSNAAAVALHWAAMSRRRAG
jgi:23S rRNA (guanosine2251-2'-O)-methyltransferase